MKKVVIALLFFITVFIDLLALDDITTGNQDNFLAEYVFLAVSLVILFFLVEWWKKV